MNKTQQLLKEREDKWNELIDMYVAPNRRGIVKECVNGNAEYNGTVRINASAIPLFRNIKSFHATTISLLLNSIKEEVEQRLTEELDMSKMLEGFEKYWTKHTNGRYIERCIECENTKRIEKTLTLLSETISNIQTK